MMPVSWGTVMFCCEAEDGIRDATVTGVQTCALPISYQTVSDRSQQRQWAEAQAKVEVRDRKSTRLNYSHGSISYAVFCFKNKTKPVTPNHRISSYYALEVPCPRCSAS